MVQTIRTHWHEMPPRLVAFGSEVVLPATYTAEVEGFAYTVSFDVATDGDGPRVTALRVEQVQNGPALTTDGMRSIPLGRLLRESVETAHGEAKPVTDRHHWRFPDPVAAEQVERAEHEVAETRRRWLLTDGHLTDVARVYRPTRATRLASAHPRPR